MKWFYSTTKGTYPVDPEMLETRGDSPDRGLAIQRTSTSCGKANNQPIPVYESSQTKVTPKQSTSIYVFFKQLAPLSHSLYSWSLIKYWPKRSKSSPRFYPIPSLQGWAAADPPGPRSCQSAAPWRHRGRSCGGNRGRWWDRPALAHGDRSEMSIFNGFWCEKKGWSVSCWWILSDILIAIADLVAVIWLSYIWNISLNESGVVPGKSLVLMSGRSSFLMGIYPMLLPELMDLMAVWWLDCRDIKRQKNTIFWRVLRHMGLFAQLQCYKPWNQPWVKNSYFPPQNRGVR